jgi:predicted SprT family Zn-dependent metalloprotease
MQANPDRCSTALRAADPDRCSTALRAADPDGCSTALRAANPDRCSTALRAANPDRCSTALRAADPRGKPLKTQGRIYDLGTMFEAVNRRYFNNKVVCSIGWGRQGKAKRGARSRMIRFGSYSRLENVIRINPVLDTESVPAEFVEYIVFHEMLHAAMPSVENGMKRMHHHRAYRLLERRFPDHARLQKMAVDLVVHLRG